MNTEMLIDAIHDVINILDKHDNNTPELHGAIVLLKTSAIRLELNNKEKLKQFITHYDTFIDIYSNIQHTYTDNHSSDIINHSVSVVSKHAQAIISTAQDVLLCE